MQPLIAFNVWQWIEEHRQAFEAPLVPQHPLQAGSRPLRGDHCGRSDRTHVPRHLRLSFSYNTGYRLHHCGLWIMVSSGFGEMGTVNLP